MSRVLTLLGLSLGLFVTGCITPSEKREMKDDLFNVQTRLLNLERTIDESSKDAKSTGSEAVKRIASTRTELDRLTHEIQTIKGDIDALKVGVTTGVMPGSSPDQEGTLAATLAKINERLEAVEQQQQDILDAISKAGVKKNDKKSLNAKGDKADKGDKSARGNKADKADRDDPATTVAELQRAYDKKHFTQVTEEGPGLLKKAPGKDKEQIRFLVAESYFRLGKMRDAALKYNEYIEGKPSKDRLPHAKMRMADAFKNLGDRDTAKLYYEELIKEFPESTEAAKAKERLAELSKAGKADKRG